MGILRFLLAISVLLQHLKQIYDSPFYNYMMVDVTAAVNSFFIISGFYMALILNEKYIGKHGSYKLFITNRFMRLFPVYWFVLILYFFYSFGHFDSYSLIFQNYIHNIFSIPSIVVLMKNIFLFNFINQTKIISLLTLSYIPGTYNYLLDPPAWSIAVELNFYLLAPFIVRLKLVKTLFLLISYLFMDLVLHHTLLVHIINTIEIYFLPNQFIYFLLGIISYWIYVKIRILHIRKEIIAYVGIIIIIFTLIYPLFKSNYLEENIYYLFITGGIPFFFMSTSRNIVSNILGELSYPIYISQEIVLNTLKSYLNFCTTNQNLITILEILAVIVFSYILYAFIMKPIDKIRANRLSKKSIRSFMVPKKIPALAVVE